MALSKKKKATPGTKVRNASFIGTLILIFLYNLFLVFMSVYMEHSIAVNDGASFHTPRDIGRRRNGDNHHAANTFLVPFANPNVTHVQRVIELTNDPPPAAGAVDESGNRGYVHDAAVLTRYRYDSHKHGEHVHSRSNTTGDAHGGPLHMEVEAGSRSDGDDVEKLPVVNLSDMQDVLCASPGDGLEAEGGHLIVEKIRARMNERTRTDERTANAGAGQAHSAPTNNSTSPSNSTHRTPRIFCAVYTYHGNVDRTNAISETWGRRCDGMMFASTFTDGPTATVHVPHAGKQGNYSYIWNKVREMLFYMHQHFANDYDYFHVCGDDTYLLVDNLRELLTRNQDKIQYPLYAGSLIKFSSHRLKLLYKIDAAFSCNGGGSGYTLNRESLRMLAEEILPTCFHDKLESAEDLYVGLCLSYFGITANDTRDELGELRYHQYGPNELYQGVSKMERGDQKFWGNQLKWMNLKLSYQPPIASEGLSAMSAESVAFHRIRSPALMRRLDLLLYRPTTIGTYKLCRTRDNITVLPS